MPPMVVVQHMPADFTGPFARRLDSISALSIREAADGDRLAVNEVLLAPGGRHLVLERRGSIVCASINDEPPESSHRPSIDKLMRSAAAIYGAECIGVIMTGMGHDGVAGCRDVRAGGGYVLGQDAATSDVYGMNKAAFVAGHVDEQFALDQLPNLLQASTCSIRRRNTSVQRQPPQSQISGD